MNHAPNGELDRRHFIETARAVLQAIREPSEVMNAAGIDADDRIEFNNHGRIWQAMVDAALEEG